MRTGTSRPHWTARQSQSTTRNHESQPGNVISVFQCPHEQSITDQSISIRTSGRYLQKLNKNFQGEKRFGLTCT